MGRRKWKLFQEVLSRSQLNTNQNRTEQTNIENLEPPILENHLTEKQEEQFTTTIKTEIKDNLSLISDKINNKEIVEDILINSTKTSPNIGEEPINPIDWKPSDKCYFCVDGKLLTVNEKGDLVAESGPALPEAELANRSTIDSDSDSRNSTPDTITNNHSQLNTKKLTTSHTRDSHPPNMTSFESMAAQIAAISKIQGLQSGLGPLYPSLWYHQLAQQLPLGPTTSETSAAALSPSNKDSPSPSETTGEQPLDLSSKPSPVFRAKPRINTAVTGRRTYTEEELAMALQDILSGKLGTRRAAVIYGIPRSTLRNKVYKIALEQKREISSSTSSSSTHQPTLDALDADDDDKDGSGDEDRDDKLLDSSLLAQQQVDHLSRYETSHLAAATLQKLRKSNVVNNDIDNVKPSTSSSSSDGQNKLLHSPVNPTVAAAAAAVVAAAATTPTPQQSQTPPITPNRWLDTNVLLQGLLLSGSLGGLPGLLQQQQPKMDDPAALQEIFNSLLMHQEELMKEQLKNSTENRDTLNNGKPNLIDPLLLMQNLPLLRQQQLGQLHTPRLPKSETPDTASSVDLNETSDDGVILKIPSFKPVVPGSSTSSKNGDSAISPSSITGHGLSSILSRSPHQTNNMSGIISPPLMRQSSESQSPPILSLREVIANSISRTFSQQQKDSNMNNSKSYNPHETTNEQHQQQQQNKKRASISVIKTIGGTDITQFASTPNLLNTYHHHHHHHHQNSMAGAAGKGTRPKRGKYRNYDRDSLVEAVKAVQRGEMSVHRAGSYYGVPHSTLEYKVKERHLMRPRKREPKPQPLDERTGTGNNSNNNNSNISSATKHSNIPGLTNVVNNIDKLKSPSGGIGAGGSSLQQSKSSSSSSGMKNSNNPPFPSTSPNGMKVPIFDSAMAAQLQYAPHLFWPHTAAGFGGLPIDFQRQAAAAAAAANVTGIGTSGQQSSGFTQQNAENFLASQMIQRFHEESNRLNAVAAASTASLTGNNNSNNNNNYQKSTNISPSLIATTNSITSNTTTNTTNLNLNNNTNNNINNNNNNNTTNINNSCSGGSSSSSSSSGSTSNVPIAKSAREIAESLYDTGGANGSSFLDGIIRQTLDRKTINDIKPHGALLDQLVKNTNTNNSKTTTSGTSLGNNINDNHHQHHHQQQQQNQHLHQSLTNNSNINNNKRSGSPIQYPIIDIKRERSNSPLAQQQQQQQQHSHLSMALTPNEHRNKRNSLTDCNKLSGSGSGGGGGDISIESSENDSLNDVTTAIKSNDGIMIKLEDNQLHSLGRLQQHHHLHQQLTSSTSSSSSTRPIIVDDLNGGNSISGNSGSGGGGGINSSILQEKLGHIKSETEDSL